MSRLFYETENQGNSGVNVTPDDMKPKTKSSGSNVVEPSENTLNQRAQLGLEKIAKLVPAEIIAAYLTILGFVTGHANEKVILTITIAVCTSFTPVYLLKLSKSGKPIRIHLLLSTLAFLIWTYAVSGEKFPLFPYDSTYASISLIFFTLASGAIPLKN